MYQNSKCEFRPCRDEEKALAAELAAMEDFERICPHSCALGDADLEHWNTFYHAAEQAIDEHPTIVAVAAGKLVGVVNYCCSSAYGTINYLYVLPERRRKGIGSTLLEYAENQIASNSIRFARVLVDPNETALIKFCESLGYEERQLIMKKRVPLTEDASSKNFDSISDGSDKHE